MHKYLKINAAIFICTAFVFRLLFVNISSFAAISTSHTNPVINAHFSNLLKKKRRKDGEAAVRSVFNQQATQEICQEGTENEDDENDSIALKRPGLLVTLFSFLKGVLDTPTAGIPFDLVKSHLYPRKYVALSVLRI